MPLFCANCGNLMTIVTTADSFNYQCNKCMKFDKAEANDTLVYEKVNRTNLTIYKSILCTAGQDPVNPKVRKNCACGEQFARQVRLGSEMKLIDTCIKCGHQSIENN